ncbi:2-amino-4-hydroxy-6-hydroxymethyldihydropteridine diphosphokinase [Dokdonia sp. Hel_I_53]|nr:2-amino-4-hydroxy-6-hydroxymethyldihydropteridine diphosphokinase [Dokdonia sp. Hel_I_53]
MLFEHVGPLIKISPVYKSPAWGFEAPDFHNCVVKMSTSLSPSSLLKKTQYIEKKLGRVKSDNKGYESRHIDIDILLYGDLIVNEPNLSIPHPLMLDRKFVLQPLVDICGDEFSEVFSKTYSSIFEDCKDQSKLTRQSKWLKNPIDNIDLSSYNYIAIEGNIGAGKTSLATMISEEFNAKLILERFKDNPFLPKFYKEPDRFAFPLEMSFLADRYQQLLDDIGQYDLFKDFMCADYDRYKSLIFAQVTLQEEEFALYKRLHEMMYREMPQPDLYIYLYQNTERLLSNIKKRGRAYEKGIAPEYLEKINQGYLDFIKSQHNLNVKIIDISSLDFVENREDFLSIINKLGKGLVN